MIAKLLKILVVIFLVILPYSMVLSNFSPYTTPHLFNDFLIASLIFGLVSLGLGWYLATGDLIRTEGVLFFLLGMIIAPPLMLGPPEESGKLLERVAEEHFRYGMLLAATLIFALGFILILKRMWQKLNAVNKLILVPFIACVLLLLWDNVSSYNFSNELYAWINSGNKADAFFPQYNYHTFIRTLGRSLIYMLIPWFAFLLMKESRVRKWQFILLTVFCGIGVLFFFLCNFVGLRFYFPFMVPAIAMAPVYWLGIVLISRKH